jgi:hypothetical protein
MSKFIIDDGFSPELVENAVFDGLFEMPLIRRNSETIIPDGLIPYSRRNTAGHENDFLMFYEHDVRFRDIFLDPENALNEVKRFKGVITPDCSLYCDMPLALQIFNTYRNRQFGHFLQENGVYTVPNVRWGDERSYRQIITGDSPFAFAGIEKHSTVAVGTYGCCKSQSEKFHLRNGLVAMLEIICPENVFVYGAMPSKVFDGLESKTNFIPFPDWTKRRHEEAENGNR